MINLPYEKMVEKYQFNKHIWEGWEVRDFIDRLEPTLDNLMDFHGGNIYGEPLFTTKAQINDWVRNNLPYTIKALRYVTKFFVDKYNGMPIFDAEKPNCIGKLKLV